VSAGTRAVVVVGALGAAVLAAAAPAVTQMFGAVDVSGDQQAMEALTPTLTILAPGLVGYALVFQLSRVLFAMERTRAVAFGVAAGWGAVLVGSLVAVRALAPDGGDGRATLVGLASGNTVGMTVAGAVLLVIVRHVAGVQSVRGVTRTVSVSGAGAVGGALVGRWVTDAVTVPVVSGVVGGLCAAVLMVAVVLLLDRGTAAGAAGRLRRVVGRGGRDGKGTVR
ncbi:hypothetical protein N869_12280, partial [Cellulomonas bogoriensis 69B4 = DSM 16987]